MSKRCGTSSKSDNPRRRRGKNNSKGKRNNSKINWPKYNKKRETEGGNCDKLVRKIADRVRELMDMRPGTRNSRVSVILLSIIKTDNQPSYWSK